MTERRRNRDEDDPARQAKAGQLTWLDGGASEARPEAVETWRKEQKRTKATTRPKRGATGQGESDRQHGEGKRGGEDGSGGVSGARMRGATPGAELERMAAEVWAPVDQEGWEADEALGRRVGDTGSVARQAVVAALRRTVGRIRDPERWTPLHLAESARADDRQLCWWGRWPLPWSPTAIRWSAHGALMATCPDHAIRGLATLALGQVARVELTAGHAAAVEYLERRIAAVARIEAAYVTRADILPAVAGLPVAGPEREEEISDEPV